MSKIVKNIIDKCRAAREDDGAAVINAVDVAKLIRAKIKEVFPGIKFSVRKSSYDSVYVSWTDGPCPSAVDSWLSQYSFGGFDGTIDMAYSSSNWLLPDGSMSPAASSGTEGSRGYVSSYATDCPEPGAVLVKYGPKYVSTSHDYSPERLRELCEIVAEEHGYEITDSALWDQYVDGEYLTTLAYRKDRELWAAAQAVS